MYAQKLNHSHILTSIFIAVVTLGREQWFDIYYILWYSLFIPISNFYHVWYEIRSTKLCLHSLSWSIKLPIPCVATFSRLLESFNIMMISPYINESFSQASLFYDKTITYPNCMKVPYNTPTRKSGSPIVDILHGSDQKFMTEYSIM